MGKFSRLGRSAFHRLPGGVLFNWSVVLVDELPISYFLCHLRRIGRRVFRLLSGSNRASHLLVFSMPERNRAPPTTHLRNSYYKEARLELDEQRPSELHCLDNRCAAYYVYLMLFLVSTSLGRKIPLVVILGKRTPGVPAIPCIMSTLCARTVETP